MKERGSAVYQLFLLVLSIYVLIVLTLESFAKLDPEVARVLQYADLMVCLVFLADFFVNLFTCERKSQYLKWGWLDLISSIPAIDTLRWGRLSRVVRILRFLRSVKSVRLLLKAVERSRFETFTTAVIVVIFISFTLSAALILEFERGYDSSINSAETSLWWCTMNLLNAKISISEAKSPGGVAVTVILNKVGLLAFAYINASLIAWLVQHRTESIATSE